MLTQNAGTRVTRLFAPSNERRRASELFIHRPRFLLPLRVEFLSYRAAQGILNQICPPTIAAVHY